MTKKIENKEINIRNIEKNNNKINKIKNKINKLTNLYLNDMVDIDFYKAEYENLKNLLEVEERTVASQKINNTRISEIKKILDKNFYLIYNSLSEKEKRIIWGKVFNYLVIDTKSKEKFILEINID